MIAVHDHNIIGHLGAINRRIKIKDSEILATLEVDGMTHPDYGRQGIFIDLGRKLLLDSEKEGIYLVCGFPNENALPGHKKLNCIELFNLNIMIRPLNFVRISKKMFPNRILGFFANLMGRFTFNVFYRPKKPHSDEEVIINTVKGFDLRFDEFWKKAQTYHNIVFHRDCKYLNWRYIHCPEKDYKVFVAEKNGELLAWIIVRVLDRFGLKNGAIVDILALPNFEDVVCKLILRAVEDLKEKGVDLIACSVPKWCQYTKLLRKCGFMACPSKLNPKEEPFIIYPLSNELDTEFLKNEKNWFITWGDTDVV
jgi:hypothetical protein